MATLVMINVKINYQLSDSEIERRAREKGMKYEYEMKVIFGEEGVE